MAYFYNFPIVNYRFGDDEDPVLFDNISVYIDLIERLVDDTVAYEYYTIQDGDRADTISFKLYGTDQYYWTLYLLNENLRQQGWPLTTQEVHTLAREYYPNVTVQTDDSLHGEFYVGDTVATISEDGLTFQNPVFKGTIVDKNFDLGQIVIKPRKEVRSFTVTNPGSGYTSIPTVTISGTGEGATAQAILDSDTVGSVVVVTGGDGYTVAPTVTISAPDIDRGDRATATVTISSNNLYRGDTLYSDAGNDDVTLWNKDDARSTTVLRLQDQYLSTHHYEDSNGDFVDFPLSSVEGKGADINQITNGNWQQTNITYVERMLRQNDDLKQIRVFKANVVEQIAQEFNRLLKQ